MVRASRITPPGFRHSEAANGTLADGVCVDAREIDHLSFLVRAQKFRIAATVMRRTPVPLATEYAIRLVHLVPEVTAEEIAAFFGFGSAEAEVLVQDMLETGLVGEREGHFSLSARGRQAISDQLDDVELFVTEEVSAIQAFDLVAFAPVEDAELAGAEARLLREIAIPDRERAARGTLEAHDAFERHFREWQQRAASRRRPDDMRLHAVEDVQSLRIFAAPFHFAMRFRPEDAAAGAAGVGPDFSGLRNQGRPGSRDALIAALSAGAQSMTIPGDHEEALTRTAEVDGGVLLRPDLRAAAGQAGWARLCADEREQRLQGAQGPGSRLIGSAASADVRDALRRGVPDTACVALHVPTPVIWLPPRATHWGRSLAFANLARELSATEPDGTILLARTDGTPRGAREWSRLFGPRDGQAAIFDRCLAVRTNLPGALEVVVKPGAWALVLVHVPEAVGRYPIPFGYITGAQAIVDGWRHLLAEAAGGAAGSQAVVWQSRDEAPAQALADIDLALGIGAA